MRRLVPLLVLLALAGCGGQRAAPPSAASTTRTTAVRTGPPVARWPLPSDGYAVTQLGQMRLLSRRVSRTRFVLMEQRLPGGRPRRAPGVRSRSSPFDVDLGTDGAGHVVAVYTRCRLVHSVVDRSVTPVACVPALWDPADGVERRLGALAAPKQSASWPSIDRGRVTFARSDEDPTETNGVTIWRAASPSSPPRRIARLELQDVMGLQARGRLVAVTGSSTSSRYDGGGMGSSPVLLLGDVARVEQVGGGAVTLEGDTEPRGLTFIGHELVWALGDRSSEETERSTVERYDIATGALLRAPVRGVLTGLSGSSLHGLIATEARPADAGTQAVPVHERLRPLRRLAFASEEGGAPGEHVRAP